MSHTRGSSFHARKIINMTKMTHSVLMFWIHTLCIHSFSLLVCHYFEMNMPMKISDNITSTYDVDGYSLNSRYGSCPLHNSYNVELYMEVSPSLVETFTHNNILYASIILLMKPPPLGFIQKH